MATTKLGNSKSASRSINYAEGRAVAMSGINVDVTHAKSSFKAIRAAYGKESGVQAHTIIQSFSPEESKVLGAEKINEMGKELAKRVAGDYQVAIYTHADKEHIHNHLVINAVNPETGRKYQSNAKQRHLVKDKNDEIMLEHGIKPVERGTAKMNYTLAEREIMFRGDISWKEQIRQAVGVLKENEEITSFDKFKTTLKDNFGMEVTIRGKTVSYKHPDKKKNVRGNKLGAAFDKEELENDFARHYVTRQNRRDEEKARARKREQERLRKQREQRIRNINRGSELER